MIFDRDICPASTRLSLTYLNKIPCQSNSLNFKQPTTSLFSWPLKGFSMAHLSYIDLSLLSFHQIFTNMFQSQASLL